MKSTAIPGNTIQRRVVAAARLMAVRFGPVCSVPCLGFKVFVGKMRRLSLCVYTRRYDGGKIEWMGRDWAFLLRCCVPLCLR